MHTSSTRRLTIPAGSFSRKFHEALRFRRCLLSYRVEYDVSLLLLKARASLKRTFSFEYLISCISQRSRVTHVLVFGCVHLSSSNGSRCHRIISRIICIIVVNLNGKQNSIFIFKKFSLFNLMRTLNFQDIHIFIFHPIGPFPSATPSMNVCLRLMKFRDRGSFVGICTIPVKGFPSRQSS